MEQNIKLKRWNWGAFSLNVIWGLVHHCWWTLLCCIPVFGLFWMFFCGWKGNEWAWEKGDYSSVEEFEQKELGWTVAGVIVFVLVLIRLSGMIFPSNSVVFLN